MSDGIVGCTCHGPYVYVHDNTLCVFTFPRIDAKNCIDMESINTQHPMFQLHHTVNSGSFSSTAYKRDTSCICMEQSPRKADVHFRIRGVALFQAHLHATFRGMDHRGASIFCSKTFERSIQRAIVVGMLNMIALASARHVGEYVRIDMQRLRH